MNPGKKKLFGTLSLVLAALFAIQGCHKKPRNVPTTVVAPGVTVDMPKLQQAFTGNKDPDIESSLIKISSGLRYGYDFNQVLMELDKLSQNPNLTEPQKKAVADAIEQTKQTIADKSAGKGG